LIIWFIYIYSVCDVEWSVEELLTII
jgi:hypothetical protein